MEGDAKERDGLALIPLCEGCGRVWSEKGDTQMSSNPKGTARVRPAPYGGVVRTFLAKKKKETHKSSP